MAESLDEPMTLSRPRCPQRTARGTSKKKRRPMAGRGVVGSLRGAGRRGAAVTEHRGPLLGALSH